MSLETQSLQLHKMNQGKLATTSLVPLSTKEDLSCIYTPGVGAVCRAIAEDESLAKTHTMIGRTVAVITDGSAVLGLGNIGPKAAMPVMEGKALLFKTMGGVDAVPICLATQDTEQIIQTICALAPTFSGINLEDISAPRCFEIEQRLREMLDIPVFHDDQHGTAVVVVAGLLNSLVVVNKNLADSRIVVNGAGAAGAAIASLLLAAGARDVIVCDSKGILDQTREYTADSKRYLAEKTNPRNISGTLFDAIKDADVFIGVSVAGALQAQDVKQMAKDPIVMAMANPIPEIMPDEAKQAGAKVVATGRSDFPNQVNNALVFPGLFKGLLAHNVVDITDELLLTVARALAHMVENPHEEHILPDVLDKQVADVIAASIASFA